MKPAFMLAFSFLVIAGQALAQSDDSAMLREKLRAMTQQLHQAQDDQAAILAQKAVAEGERDALKKQLSAAQAEIARFKHDGQKVSAVEGDLAKAKDALNQANNAATQNKSEYDKLQSASESAKIVLEACEAKNKQLLDVSREILTAYENFDFVDSVSAREPFLRLKRVELENLAQGYQDRIDGGAFDPKTVHTPAPSEPTQQQNPPSLTSAKPNSDGKK